MTVVLRDSDEFGQTGTGDAVTLEPRSTNTWTEIDPDINPPFGVLLLNGPRKGERIKSEEPDVTIPESACPWSRRYVMTAAANSPVGTWSSSCSTNSGSTTAFDNRVLQPLRACLGPTLGQQLARSERPPDERNPRTQPALTSLNVNGHPRAVAGLIEWNGFAIATRDTSGLERFDSAFGTVLDGNDLPQDPFFNGIQFIPLEQPESKCTHHVAVRQG
jgi:hypothetical protein